MYQCEVDVLAPTSMVRIQVKDDRPTEKADIGFFDVCLGDIPYDKVGIHIKAHGKIEGHGGTWDGFTANRITESHMQRLI